MELNVYFVIAAKEFVVDTILFLHCPSVTRSVSVFTQKSCGSIFCNYRSSANVFASSWAEFTDTCTGAFSLSPAMAPTGGT